MNASLQGSLLDLSASPGPGPLDQLTRTELTHGAWVDYLPGWMAGADELFGRLLKVVPWRAERRWMYERVVEVPRLLCFYGEGEQLPDPLLASARDALDARYAAELGEKFVTAGLCLYRDGRDSVAWHGDTISRAAGGSGGSSPRASAAGGSGGSSPRASSCPEDTMVAILSLGTPRPLLLRPAGGGPALRHDLGHGDLLVMGGSCQRTWQHAIPKSARPTGPRISVQFRPPGVR